MRIIALFIPLLIGLLIACPLHSQVTADFTSNVNTGCNSLQVSFTDLSTSVSGSIESWSWDLGGVISTNQNPGRIFGTPDTYTICLTVTDSDGNVDTECKDNFIQVYHLPEPAFAVESQFGCAPVEINFSDESSSIDGEIVEWIWGLGGTSGVIVENETSQGVSSIYENPDSYIISLTVIDDNNCENTLTEDDFITIFDFPIIDVSLSDSFNCSAPYAIDITNNNPDPNVIYTWDFGNGGTYQGANPPTVLYQTEGSFTISVIAENNATSCIDTLILDNAVNIGNAVSFMFTPSAVCQDATISFANTSKPGTTDFQWDFGDGNVSTLASPSHVYTTPGCYFVTLSGMIDGCVDTYSITECIEVFPLPTVSFLSAPKNGCVLPHEVGFTTFSNTFYAWDFGDGNTSDVQNPSHTYTEFGIYPISLEITDNNGCTNTALDTIRVIELEAQMNIGTLSGCSPVDVNLSENSISVSPINSWSWSVDTSFSDPGSPLLTSTDPMPSFSISDTGWYDVTLIVTNAFGCLDTIVNTGAIGVGLSPEVDFSAEPLIACVDQTIQFTDLSTGFGDWWFWDFGDGNFSEEQNPIHDYNLPDTFDISLTVAHNGCETFLSIPDYILIQEPLASFMIERDCGDPYRITFVNNSRGADSTFWDFGYDENLEMDTSSLLNPIIDYPGTGCYTATQIVYNFTTGCTDSLEMEFCITDPAASFNLSPLSGCRPLMVNVDNTSAFDVSWQWSAPGGNISNPAAKNPVITYPNVGFYSDVQLIITDANNCRDTIVFTDTIEVDGVDVSFESQPSGGCSPLEVQFVENSSSFLSPIESWSWNINNGALITSDQNTSFFFDTIGTYPVSLTVTNERGCVSTLNVIDAVNVTVPIPSFTTDSISCPSDTVLFSNTSIGEGLTYVWDFGDGLSSTEENPNHQFLSTGTYEVCLTITDFASCEKDYCQQIDIVLPIAAFSSDTSYANCPPLIVNFENQSQNALFYEWDFGDESGVSDLENPPHVYTVPGFYDVQLIASINENCTDTLVISDYIEIEGPLGDFFFDIDTACAPELITFVGSSDDDFTYVWDFGDGVLDTTYNISNDTIGHVYTEGGRFVPKLILIDSENCQRTLESPDTITIGLLAIDFTATDSTLCEGIDETQFINLINSSENIIDLEWLFESGSPLSSTAFEPTVSFPNMGTYDVTLIVENTFCRDTLTKENFIGAGALPVADFTSSTNSGCIPLGVQFNDQSTASDGSIVAWDWDFGREEGSEEVNPYHFFTIADTVDVVLTVTTEFNCSDSASTQMILYAAAESTLSASESEICIGDVIELTAEIAEDTTDLDFHWLPDPTLSCEDCFNPIADPIVTTTYFFVTNTPQNCPDTNSITVNVLPFTIPEISITADTTLCINESLTLSVSSPDMVTYDWNADVDSISCLDCSNPVINPTESTTYVVTVTNNFGCDDIDSVFVEVVDQTSFALGEDRTICEGDTVQLELLVDGTALWLNNNDLSCINCTDPLAFPDETTTFPVLIVTADYGCELTDTIQVNVYGADDIEAGDDMKICIGESITLNASTNSPGTIFWTPANSLDIDTILNPSATPTDTTVYVLRVEEDLCILEDSLEIEVQFVTDVESFDYEICAGDTVQIEYVGEADNIEWSPETYLSDPLSESPLVFPTETTEYILTASLSTCAEDTAIATVLVNQAPQVVVPERYDKFPGVALQIDLEIVSGSGDYTIDWLRFDGLSCNNCASPILSIDTFGFYNVIVRDELNGCETEKAIFINLLKNCDPELISVPNIFTPNNDSYNDKIEIFSEVITEISVFRVFNRWGALVFETNDINEGWDGRYRGKRMPSGVYVYYIQATCPINRSALLKKGDFTLKR